MPINPFSTPMKTEYKPLGLERFMQPLSQMQAKFDVAKSEIDDTKYKLERMSQDDPRAKEILSDLNQRTGELSENLVRTGNYRQATQKLKSLNREYAENPEIQAITSNYTNYKNTYNEIVKRIEEGKNTEEDLQLWDYNIKNKYEGAQYDPVSKSYSTLSTRPPVENLEDEFRKEALALAKMTVENAWNEIQNMGLDVYGDRQILETIYKSKDLNKITPEIENFLKNSDKYKNWIEETARRKFYMNHNESKKAYQRGLSESVFADDVVEDSLNLIDKGIKEAIGKGNIDNPEDPDTFNQLQNVRENIIDQIASGDPNIYEQLAENLFVQQSFGKFHDVARDAGDLVDKLDVTQNIETSGDGAGKKAATEKIDKTGNFGVSVASMDISADLLTNAGASPFTKSENEIVGTKNLFQLTSDKLIDLTNQTYYGTAVKSFDPKVSLTIATGEALTSFSDAYDKKIKERSDEIINFKNEKANIIDDPNRVKELEAEILKLSEENAESTIAKTAQLEPLQHIFLGDSNLAVDQQEKEIQDLYKQAKEDPVVFYNLLSDYLNESFKDDHARIEEINKSRIEQEQAKAGAERDRQSTGDFRGGEFQPQPDIRKDLGAAVLRKSEEERIQESINEKIAEDPKLSYAIKIADEFNRKITIEGDTYAQPLEIKMDDSLDAATDNISENIIDEFKNRVGIEKALAVKFNTKTGETKAITAGTGWANYNPDLYNWDGGMWVGNDENGIPIFKFPIKPSYSTGHMGEATVHSQYKSGYQTKTDPEKRSALGLSSSQIASLKVNNPDYIYLSTQGFSRGGEFTNKLKEYYTQGISLAMATSDPVKRRDLIDQVSHNYATVHLLSNPERRNRILQMSENLTKKARNKVVSPPIIQGPAVWERISENEFAGNKMIYYTTPEGRIASSLYRVYAVKDGDEMKIRKNQDGSDVQDLVVSENINTANLATTLIQHSLMYGVGDDNDIFIPNSGNYKGSPFVVSMLMPDMMPKK